MIASGQSQASLNFSFDGALVVLDKGIVGRPVSRPQIALTRLLPSGMFELLGLDAVSMNARTWEQPVGYLKDKATIVAGGLLRPQPVCALPITDKGECHVIAVQWPSPRGRVGDFKVKLRTHGALSLIHI